MVSPIAASLAHVVSGHVRAGKGRQPQQKKQKKQRKPLSPEAEIRHLITCAAQQRDPAAALAAYSRAVAEGSISTLAWGGLLQDTV